MVSALLDSHIYKWLIYSRNAHLCPIKMVFKGYGKRTEQTGGALAMCDSANAAGRMASYLKTTKHGR
jgi:hypothetical protein